MEGRGRGAQPKSEQLGVRVTKEERRLIEDLAVARGTTIDGILREHGVDGAVKIAREVHERFKTAAAS